MNNEQIVVIREFALFGLLAVGVAVMVFYLYWQQVKTITSIFKGVAIALLVALGIYDDTDNNSDATS